MNNQIGTYYHHLQHNFHSVRYKALSAEMEQENLQTILCFTYDAKVLYPADAQPLDATDKTIAFKNCALFTNSATKINNTAFKEEKCLDIGF